MTAASNIQIRDYRDGNLYNDWFDRSTNKVVTAGYGYGGYNWVVVVKFDLDKASGGLSLSLTAGDVRGSYRELNYKIVPAAEYDEDSPYNNATYDMAADGKLTMSRYNYTPITAKISGIRPSGTYYLYLWTAREANPNATCYSAITNNGNGRITVEYDEVAGTASTLALVGGVMGQPVSIAITRDNSGFVHTLRWLFAGSGGEIVAETADINLTWTPDVEQFGALIPTASSGLLTIECTTLYEGELIGTTSASITLSVPADSAPVLSEGWAMLSHTNEGTAASVISACVVGFSKAVVTFDVSKVSARYGAKMKSLTARLGGLTSEGGVLGTITSTETAVVVTATDSRGKSSSETLSISAYPYSVPVLSGVSVYRADSSGAESEAGAFYAVTAAVTYSAAGGAINCELTAAVKPAGGSYGAEDALVSGETAVLGGALSDTATYIVRVSALDTLGGTASVEVTIPTAAVAFHIREGGDGIGLGKYGEAAGAVDSAFDLVMNGHRIVGLDIPQEDGDAVPKRYINGLGLGTAAVAVDNWDNATDTGFYKSEGNSHTGYGTTGFAIRRSDNIIIQCAWNVDSAGATWDVAERVSTKGGTSWTPWEYRCPPLLAGKEYRTTERWQGKPVYTKLLNFGAMPNNSSAYLVVSEEAITLVSMRVIRHGNYPQEFPVYQGTTLYAMSYYQQSANRLYIETKADLTGYTAVGIVKYVKG